MSTGVKKPPVAPKPKIALPQKPAPPPIAPKPDVIPSYPSPAALKRAKPAVAPKPCLPKTPSPPEPKQPVTLKGGSRSCAQGRSGSSETLGTLNSRNGLHAAELSKPDSDYIIPTCICDQDGCPHCDRLPGCETTEITIEPLENRPVLWQNGRTHPSVTPASPVPGVRGKMETTLDKTGNGKSQVVNASFLEQKLKDVWVQAVSTNMKHRPQEKLPTQNGKVATANQNLTPVRNTNGSGWKHSLPERTQSDEINGNFTLPALNCQPEDVSGPVECSTDLTEGGREDGQVGELHDESRVPAAPRKPLPIPTPRKPRKPALVRQDGVEKDATQDKEEQAEQKAKSLSVVRSSPFLSPKVFIHTQSVTYARSPAANQDHLSVFRGSDTGRTRSFLSLLCTRRPSSLPLPLTSGLTLLVRSVWRREDEEKEKGELSVAISENEKSTKEEEEEEEEEDGYGFARYPVTRSLPKQMKLNCKMQLSVATRATSAEEKSPKVAPKKPQRHSLPASGLLRKEPSEEGPEQRAQGGGGRDLSSPWEGEEGRLCIEENVDTAEETEQAMKELPSPPVGKTSWRFPRTIFGRQGSRNGSTSNEQGKATGMSLGKQRAKSFSAADLIRSDGQKRSSFRRLLELKLSVKIFPKLLSKGSQSLDCTAVETEQSVDGEWVTGDLDDASVQKQQGPLPNGQCVSPDGTPGSQRKLSSPTVGVEQSVDGEDYGPGVESPGEYENLPFYEEIPEYMNLPFVNATRLGWQNSSSLEDHDEDIYEEQEPYELHKTHRGPHEQHRLLGHGRAPQKEGGAADDGHSGDEGMIDSSDEDDGGSSASSKGELELSGDQQHEIEVKKNKVVHIAKEIMSSEKVFVDVLKLLHIDFRDAVAKASRQSGKPVIEERALNQILYYLPQLYELNRDLLRELEERVARWTDHQQLADIFVKKGPYLKMYSTYIREFDRNVALLDEQCRKNPGFAAVVREFELSPRCASLALKHYLLKPVQRIPQYQLLLTDYLKNLLEESSDYKDTQAALCIVKEVANHANDIMKQGDNFQKLMQIQYSLNGHHEIVQPGRVFLKEGILMKLSRKVMQPRMFFLFNDAVLYSTPVQSGQYKLNSMLSLAGMKVSKPSQEAYQNELTIESVERSFILSAGSATERDEWLEAISTAIEDYTRKKITFFPSRTQEEAAGGASTDSGAPLGSKAPIWIPDLRATMCMICTCEFTLTWRRHHCRACGKVVCQACSTHKHYLEYLKNQPARVCDHCFLKLQHKSDQVDSPSGKSFSSVLISSRKQKKIPAALKEDVAALESQPLLGFFLREERSAEAQKLQFKLYHKNTLFHIFKAEDVQTAQRWIYAFQEAMVL
ncbi:hypothetical protein AAFF_G00061120 [Aldrovandia affinis]|uniref:FYVE, RhoGEF and PH domain containing 6 n=1 Tax=Aldrovandia affinis TaxID=143900 RepID=A0AAD7WE90_9TELE|nr:hypothetical protein AAFF_G00061120 [Aldrovandia affinis]